MNIVWKDQVDKKYDVYVERTEPYKGELVIKEGNKERVQMFQGVVLQRKGASSTRTFTVRKISNGVGVERIFPLHSPKIEKIVVDKIGIVRRARIFYLRGISGKKARIKEKKGPIASKAKAEA